jgi:hypothetical protein
LKQLMLSWGCNICKTFSLVTWFPIKGKIARLASCRTLLENSNLNYSKPLRCSLYSSLSLFNHRSIFIFQYFSISISHFFNSRL